MATSSSNPTGTPGNGVYWVGADGNIYAKAAGYNGVQNWGPASQGADNPMIDVINGLQQISDPNAPTTPTPTGGGSSTPTDSNAVAYYTDLINQLTTQLQGAEGMIPTGQNNIENAYQKAVGRTNDAQSTALSGLAAQSAQNGQQRETNVGQINNNAYNAYNSLMSLLGHAGAGVSSSANSTAPMAVSKNASGQRAGATQTYNANNNAISTATDQTKQGYANALADLLDQKNSNMQNFMTGILNQEGQLQQQIGSAQINRAQYGGESYAQAAAGAGNTTAAVQNIQDQLNQIFQQYQTPTYTPKAVSVTTPNLASFSADPTVIKAQAANPNTDQSFLPYLTQLKDQNLGGGVLTGAASPAPAAGAA